MTSLASPYRRHVSALADFGGARKKLFSQAGIGLFLLGMASGIPVEVVGRLLLGEVLLIGAAPVVVLLLLGIKNQYGKTARLLLTMMIVGLTGYVIADILRGTPSSDYLRGWSRWIAMGATFSTLAWLSSRSISYLLSFLVGLSFGACVAPFVVGGFTTPILYWKYHASLAVCIITLVAIRRFNGWITVAALLALAMLSIALDTRSIALLCLITAGVTALALRRGAGVRRAFARVSKTSFVVTAVLMVGVLIGAVFVIKHFGERFGYTKRFENSNATRLASATVAWSAVKDSPFIGHGSWPRDPELALQRDKLVRKAKGVAHRMASQEDLIISHSQVLQGWLEGGLLGLLFFVVLIWHIGGQLSWLGLAAPYMPLTPIILFMQLDCLWNVIFSPFSGGQRVLIPASCVFICYVSARLQAQKIAQKSVRGAMAGFSPLHSMQTNPR